MGAIHDAASSDGTGTLANTSFTFLGFLGPPWVQ
jgi:hypothetical protein